MILFDLVHLQQEINFPPLLSDILMLKNILIFLYQVEQERDDTDSCDDASSFCGLRNKLYPDKRAMGFPFDRIQRKDVFSLKEFVGNLPNLKVTDVKIYFHEPENANDI